jgi:hypothetical protein
MATVLDQPVLDPPLPSGQETTDTSITPPNSDNGKKDVPDGVPSELSDLELDSSIAPILAEEEGEEIEPDHYYGGGKIPVFKPVSSGPFISRAAVKVEALFVNLNQSAIPPSARMRPPGREACAAQRI